jgi:4-alpha-glucanotransferase
MLTALCRGWWEEDRALTQQFWEQTLGQHGPAPQFLEPWIAEMIINQHLYCPSMLTIFPIQVNSRLHATVVYVC